MGTLQPFRRVFPILLVLSLNLVLLADARDWTEFTAPAGWTRIKDSEGRKYASEVARFALKQHYKETGEILYFHWAITTYVKGNSYKLLIEAQNDIMPRVYEALVIETVPRKVRKLVFFRLWS